MAKMQVKATVPEKKLADGSTRKQIGPFTIEVETGDTAAQLIQLFGDEAVKSNAESNWTITLQSNMRAGMLKGEDQASLQARLGNAKMGVAVRGVVQDPVQMYLAKFAASTPEQQQAMLAELKARAAKK